MRISSFVLILAVCFILVYALSSFSPQGKKSIEKIIGAIYPELEQTMIYSFYGGSAQSAKCTPSTKSTLTEPNAIFIDKPKESKLVGNVTLKVHMMVTCENTEGRKWRLKVNDNTVYESDRCFLGWDDVDVSFPSDYLHDGNNKVSLECDPTSQGSFYIGLGKTSEGDKEFFRTVYYLKPSVS
jgi:hypothetical protein